MPTLRIPPVLRRYSGGAADVRVGGGTVRAALSALFAAHPALGPRVLNEAGEIQPYLLLFRNDERLEPEQALDAPLAADDVLEIVGAAEGG